MSWFRQLINKQRARYNDDEIAEATVIVQLLEEEEQSKPRRGSVIGRQVVARDRLSGHACLMEDYFVPNPVCDDDFFCCRYISIIMSCIYGLSNAEVKISHSYVPVFSGSE
jgi:hypothetical protein